MRIIIYKKIAAVSLILGFFLGIITSLLSGEETADAYGAWIQSFYRCEEIELLIKSFFSGPFFVFTIFTLGLFIFGYLFIYPTAFYWSYTFGFLITTSFICFGKEAFWSIILKLPSLSATSYFLYKESAIATKFSTEIFTNTEFKELRTQTSQYIGIGLSLAIFSLITAAYETFFVPKILNLWVSF